MCIKIESVGFDRVGIVSFIFGDKEVMDYLRNKISIFDRRVKKCLRLKNSVADSYYGSYDELVSYFVCDCLKNDLKKQEKSPLVCFYNSKA